jgi:hypothetical protein
VWHNHQSMPHKVQQLDVCARGYTNPYVLIAYTNTKDKYNCSSVANGAHNPICIESVHKHKRSIQLQFCSQWSTITRVCHTTPPLPITRQEWEQSCGIVLMYMWLHNSISKYTNTNMDCAFLIRKTCRLLPVS